MPKPRNHLLPLALVLVMLAPLPNLMAAAGWSVNNIDITDGQDEARTVFCKGETVKLTVTDTCSSTAKRSYSWSPGGSTNNPLILTNLNAGNYTSTVTVTIGAESGQASAGLTVVQVASISTNSNFSATAYPIYVGSNTTIKFYAKPSSVGQWPAGKPAWGGVASGSGSNQVTVTFDATGTNYVTAECGNTVTATVVVIKVEIEGAPQSTYDGLDTESYFECKVLPTSVTPSSYSWSAGWYIPASNNPQVSFTLPINSVTRISNAHWYASENDPHGYGASTYKIYCLANIGGHVFSNAVPAEFRVYFYSPGGWCNPPTLGQMSFDAIETNGYYEVIDVAEWNRTDAQTVNEYSTNSQFYLKVQGHEQKHKDDYDNGFTGHIFCRKDEFAPMIIGLTNAILAGLQAMVQEKYEQYYNAEITEMNSVTSNLEERAYAVSDTIPPFYVYQQGGGGL